MGRQLLTMGCGPSKDNKDKDEKNQGSGDAPTQAPAQPKPAPKPTTTTSTAGDQPQKAAPIAAKWYSPELKDMMYDYFTRYDLDGSGTINSSEELKQLCTNLVVKLELDMDVATIDKKVGEAGDMEEKQWDYETFMAWFVAEENFAAFPAWVPNDLSDSDDEPPEGESWLRCGTYDITMSSEGCEDYIFPLKLRYTDSDKTKLLRRVCNDDKLGADEVKEGDAGFVASGKSDSAVNIKYRGLHSIEGSVDNAKKTITIVKKYDVDCDAATKEPIFEFIGSEDGIHTKVKGKWEDKETDANAAVIRGQLGVGTSGTFT